MTNPPLARELKPCPFCGGPATFIGNGVNSKVYGIVCCADQGGCLGYHWPDGEYGGYTHATTKDMAITAWNTRLSPEGEVERLKADTLNDIGVMMSEFVDNWPQPKQIKTALALIAKAFRAALDPPKHKFWGAGEADCPREIKAGNGELHTLRCKVCGQDNPRDDRCLASTPSRDRDNG